MNDKKSELTVRFEENYTANMSAATATTDGPEHTLEKVNALLRIGWTAQAIDEIESFEEMTGLDFSELAEQVTTAPHVEDPREDR